MGGAHHHAPRVPGQFVAPHVHGRWGAKLMMVPVWFFVMYRTYHDGPHHFLHKHQWEEPKFIAHLEEVDKKFGTTYATDNMHHH
ncbi:hypothetical protein HDU86_001864 [Geranomyces michiganensis]|nr:hypothetical protein HDU86_001864 [Geranomyces michiganensis]